MNNRVERGNGNREGRTWEGRHVDKKYFPNIVNLGKDNNRTLNF